MQKRFSVCCPYQIQLLLGEQKSLLISVVSSTPTVSSWEIALKAMASSQRGKNNMHRREFPISFSTLQHHHHCKSVPVPFYRVKRANWRDRGIGRRREEKSSHLAGHDLKDFTSEIQSIVNISPNRITLKPLHRCYRSAAACQPEAAKGSFANRRRRKLSGFLEIPWLGNFPINVDKSQKGRREENRLLFFSHAEQQTWAERQNNWLSMLFLFPLSLI